VLIGVSANAIWVQLTFASENNIGRVMRHVELSWNEARDLHEDLGLLLRENVVHDAGTDQCRDLSQN